MYVPKSDQEWRTVRQWLTLGLCAVGSLAVVILLARTAVGAITSPPGPWLTAVLSAVGFAAAMTIWRLDDIDRPSVELRTRVWRLMAAWLAALLFGLLVARQSVAGVATVSVVAATWALVGIGFVRSSWLNRPTQPAERAPENPLAGVSGQLGQLEQFPRSVEDDSTVRLLLRRSATADGESLEIQARLEFAAGAREAVLHVPLWPALAARPAIEGEPLDADDVELKFTSVEAYGIRMEARLASPTAVARSVLIGIELHAPAADELSAAA